VILGSNPVYKPVGYNRTVVIQLKIKIRGENILSKLRAQSEIRLFEQSNVEDVDLARPQNIPHDVEMTEVENRVEQCCPAGPMLYFQ